MYDLHVFLATDQVVVQEELRALIAAEHGMAVDLLCARLRSKSTLKDSFHSSSSSEKGDLVEKFEVFDQVAPYLELMVFARSSAFCKCFREVSKFSLA
jgi:hypothetical protein